MRITILIFSLVLIFCGCRRKYQNEEKSWKLGWRMIENSMFDENSLANQQFDSLLQLNIDLPPYLIKSGLENMIKLHSENKEITRILSTLDTKALNEVCQSELLGTYEECKCCFNERITNKELQIEIIEMFVKDQLVRNNVKSELINKYEVDTTGFYKYSGSTVDSLNRLRLDHIINNYSLEIISGLGKDALRGLFLIIQHADQDKKWQENRLELVSKLVDSGKMEPQNYAYLYDRIQINKGLEQKYGTQFKNVDPVNNIVELFPVVDSLNLDKRRKKLGLMPIETYKRIMLRHVMK